MRNRLNSKSILVDHWNQRLSQLNQSTNPTRYFPHCFLEILIFDRADPTNVGVWTKFMVEHEKVHSHVQNKRIVRPSTIVRFVRFRELTLSPSDPAELRLQEALEEFVEEVKIWEEATPMQDQLDVAQK